VVEDDDRRSAVIGKFESRISKSETMTKGSKDGMFETSSPV
jgi:hypothetical protein